MTQALIGKMAGLDPNTVSQIIRGLEQKELIMVDYKSSTTGKIYPEYKQQLEFYAYLFRQKNYAVSKLGYLLFYTPIMNCKTFDWQLKFESNLTHLVLDDTWVDSTIADALECLNLHVLPDVGVSAVSRSKKCNVCAYYEQRLEKSQKISGSTE